MPIRRISSAIQSAARSPARAREAEEGVTYQLTLVNNLRAEGRHDEERKALAQLGMATAGVGCGPASGAGEADSDGESARDPPKF